MGKVCPMARSRSMVYAMDNTMERVPRRLNKSYGVIAWRVQWCIPLPTPRYVPWLNKSDGVTYRAPWLDPMKISIVLDHQRVVPWWIPWFMLCVMDNMVHLMVYTTESAAVQDFSWCNIWDSMVAPHVMPHGTCHGVSRE